jgi:hypothetical protein
MRLRRPSLVASALAVYRLTSNGLASPPVGNLHAALALVIADDEHPAIVWQPGEAPFEAVEQGAALVGILDRRRKRRLEHVVYRGKAWGALAIEEHHPRDAVRVLADVLHGGGINLPREAVERDIGALLRRPGAAPVEELHQTAAQPLVLLGRLLGVRMQPLEQPAETVGGHRAGGIEGRHPVVPESRRFYQYGGRFAARSPEGPRGRGRRDAPAWPGSM